MAEKNFSFADQFGYGEEADAVDAQMGTAPQEFTSFQESFPSDGAKEGEFSFADQFGYEGGDEPEAPVPEELGDDPMWEDYGRMVMSGGANVGAGVGWMLEKMGEASESAGADWLGDKWKRSGKATKESFLEASDDWMTKNLDAVGLKQEGLSDRASKAMEAELLGAEATGTEKWNKIKLMTASSLLGTMGGMGMGAVFSKGLQGAGMAQGTAATIGYGAGEAAVATGAAGAFTEKEVRDMSHEQLMESLEYQATLDGLSGIKDVTERQDKAKDLVARAAGNEAAALTAVSTFILSAPFGGKLDDIISGTVGAAKGRLTAGVQGAGVEATQEFLQSGAEKMSENVAMMDVDPNRTLMEGVLEEAVGGAAAGGLMGGAVGLGTGPAPTLDQQTALDAIEESQRRAEAEAAARGADSLEQAIAGDEAAEIEATKAQQAFEEQAAKDVQAEKKEAFEAAEKEAALKKEGEAREAEYQKEIQAGEQVEAAERGGAVEEPVTMAEAAPELVQVKEQIQAKKEAKVVAEKKQKGAAEIAEKKIEKIKAAPKAIPDMRPIVVDKAGTATTPAQVDAQIREAAAAQKMDEPGGVQTTEGGRIEPIPVKVAGMNVLIESPKGSTRQGTGTDGKPWKRKLRDHYGEIRGTKGKDGDKVDVFLGSESQDTAVAKKGKPYPMAPRGEWYGEADYEARGGRLDQMTPDAFLAQAAPLEIDEVARENIDDLKAHIQAGRKLDPLNLYPGETARDSDGRHRAIAAKELGIGLVPVVNFRAETEDQQTAFVIDQINQNTNEFDEHKVMLGYPNQMAAVKAYKRNFDRGWKVGPVTEMSVEQLKDWLKDGRVKNQPVSGETVAQRATPADIEAMQERAEFKGRKRPKVLYRMGDAEITVRSTPSPKFLKGEELPDNVVQIEATRAGEPRGGVAVMPRSENFQIIRAWVPKESRGEGIGQQLVVEAVRYANEQGGVLVSDNTVSTAQLRVYEALRKSGELVIEYEDPGAVQEALAHGDPNFSVVLERPIVKRMFVPEFTEDIRYRLRSEGAESVDKFDMATTLRRIAATMPAANIEILGSPEEAPARVYDTMVEDGRTDAAGLFDTDSGTVYVFTENNRTVEEAVQTLLHEAVAHKGLRALLGIQMPALLEDVWQNGNQNAIERIAERYELDINDTAERQIAVEEYIAELAERQPDAPLLQRVVDAIRQFLREAGILEDWTDSDVHALLRDARRELGGKPLNKITIASEAQIEETGEIVQLEEPADVVLRQHDKRTNVVQSLRECVG